MLFTHELYQKFITQYDKLLTERDWLARGRQLLPPELKQDLYIHLPRFYRDCLPLYTIARCPLCGGKVTEVIDTFSLNGLGWWFDEPVGFGWWGRTKYSDSFASVAEYTTPSYKAHCACVQAVMYGVNVNGILPSDVKVSFLVIGSERPHLLRPFMEQEGSCAVLSTFPIGRLDAPPHQTPYTAYFVTYFSATPQAFEQALAPQEYRRPDFCWPYDQVDYHLQPWFTAGKLFWLNAQEQLENNIPTPYLNWPGLEGRWRIKYGRLGLLPASIPLDKIPHSRYYAIWQKTETDEQEALKNRPLRPFS